MLKQVITQGSSINSPTFDNLSTINTEKLPVRKLFGPKTNNS